MSRDDAIPIGPHVHKIVETAYRARRAVLLEGPTGIGKSELVRAVGAQLGIEVMCLDLSLLEPPDLVGLPTMSSGRTVYATPSALPTDGFGILLLEELNRAERHVQQPALQLLTARRLHEYELPPGWSCVAAINPEDGDYHVTALDPALRARFLQVGVRADRWAWLAWATKAEVHPAVIATVRAHDGALDEVPPRSWTYASDILRAIAPDERANENLLRDLVRGYVGPVWADVLASMVHRYAGELEIRPLDLVARYDHDPSLRAAIRGYRAAGKTDTITEIVRRLVKALQSPEAGELAREGELRFEAFEALLADIEGDARELLQEAVGGNATVACELGLAAEDVLAAEPDSELARDLAEWSTTPLLAHRAMLIATLLVAYARTCAQRFRPAVAWSETHRAVLAPVLAMGGPAADALRTAMSEPIPPVPKARQLGPFAGARGSL